MTQGWKKAVSVMLCAAMILSVSSVMISADDENKPAAENVIEQNQPENENTNETPENNITEGEIPDAENEKNKETSEAVKSVIAQLEALPKLDDLTEETDTEKLKSDVESAKTAFDALTEAEKASISEELKGNLADLDIFVTNFIVNTPTILPEDSSVGEQIPMIELEDTTEQTELKGQGTEQEPYFVSNEEEFKAAIAKGGYIQLVDDITLPSHLVIDKNTILNMGNHKITGTGICTLVIKKAEVTFIDGKIDMLASDKPGNAVQVSNGSTLKIRGTEIKSQGTYGNGAILLQKGKLIVESGNLHGKSAGVLLGESGASLVVTGGTISGGDFGISGNGSVPGTEVTIDGGTIIGENACAIYHPQEGILTVNGGYIEGKTGIEIRAGSLEVNGGTIKGNAESTTVEPNESGSTTMGAGIAIAQHTTKKEVHVVINHGNIEAATALKQSNPQKNPVDSSVNIAVTGGSFVSTVENGNAVESEDVKDFISGGSFSNHINSKYLDDRLNAELYSPNRNPDAPFSYYPSVEDAKDEAEQFGGTVTDMETGKQEVIPAPSNPKPEKPSKPSNGSSSNSGSSNSDTTVDKEEEDYNEFWDKVIDRINKADEGDTITVHAGNYDKIPNKVMKALEKNGVGLIIKYNGGKIEIPAGEAVNKSNKLFWSFKELGNYVFALEDNNEQNNDEQDNEQSNGSENNAQSNTQTEQKPSGTAETKPNPDTGSEDYVGLAAVLAVTAGVAVTVLGKKK